MAENIYDNDTSGKESDFFQIWAEELPQNEADLQETLKASEPKSLPGKLGRATFFDW